MKGAEETCTGSAATAVFGPRSRREFLLGATATGRRPAWRAAAAQDEKKTFTILRTPTDPMASSAYTDMTHRVMPRLPPRPWALASSDASARHSSTKGSRQKIPFHQQLTDLRLQLLNLRLRWLCRFLRRRTVEKHRRQPFHRLLFPLSYHGLVDVMLARQLCRCQFTAQHFKSNLRLEIGRIPLFRLLVIQDRPSQEQIDLNQAVDKSVTVRVR